MYTYTIFDNDPNESDGNAWPSHTDEPIEADSDAEACEAVRDVLETEAAGLNTSDGYAPGQRIYALVWDADDRQIERLSHELTHEDLGVETEAERLSRAAKHVSAVDLGDDVWAHYADETSRWYTVDASELAELCDYLDHSDPAIRRDAYSHWCAGTEAREMPEGWTP